MPQLHLYLPQALADEVRRRAELHGVSVSAFLAELVKERLEDSWPPGYLDEVLGSMHDAPLSLPPEWDFPEREALA